MLFIPKWARDLYIRADDMAISWIAVFHFDNKVTLRINSSDLMLSLKPDTNISLKIITIDDIINKSLNLLISGIKVRITSSLSAIGSKILPISVSWLFFRKNNRIYVFLQASRPNK